MTTRLIIDTDIGTDVDDLWTLAMLPRLSNVTLEAVTVVYGDTELRARLAAVALEGMGIDVPVYRGCETPMSGADVMWAGHEGEGVDGLEAATYAPGHAVQVLIDSAARQPGTLDVLAIGPLTNVAVAIERDPGFVGNLRHLTVMGGEMRHGWREHNFASDARATEMVLTSGVPMTVMPLDQTLRVQLDRADAQALAAAHPIGPLLADQAERFWAWLARVMPGAKGDASAAHDPLALLALVDPSLFTFAPMVLTAHDGAFDGRLRAQPDDASPIRVVSDLDVAGARAALLGLLQVDALPGT